MSANYDGGTIGQPVGTRSFWGIIDNPSAAAACHIMGGVDDFLDVIWLNGVNIGAPGGTFTAGNHYEPIGDQPRR